MNKLWCGSPAVAEKEHSTSTTEKTNWTMLSQWFRALIAVDRSYMSVSILKEESFELELIDPSLRRKDGGSTTKQWSRHGRKGRKP